MGQHGEREKISVPGGILNRSCAHMYTFFMLLHHHNALVCWRDLTCSIDNGKKVLSWPSEIFRDHIPAHIWYCMICCSCSKVKCSRSFKNKNNKKKLYVNVSNSNNNNNNNNNNNLITIVMTMIMIMMMMTMITITITIMIMIMI